MPMKKKTNLRNKYYILRHGEALSNVKNIASSWPEKFKNPLTTHGKKMVKKAAKKLKNKHIDLIFSSDLLRTRQTAEIVAKELKIKPIFDKRLREVGFGYFNGKPMDQFFYLSFPRERERVMRSVKRTETYTSVLRRISAFLKRVESLHKRKNILLVSHQCPLWILESNVNGFSLSDGLKQERKEKRIGRAELRELN